MLVVPPVPDGVIEGPQGALEPAVPVVLPSPSAAKETALDEINGLVINGVVRLFCQFAKQVNNQTLGFIAIQKGEQQWTDKCKHEFIPQEGW